MATWTGVLHATRHGVMAYAVVECAAGSVAGILRMPDGMPSHERQPVESGGGGGAAVYPSGVLLFLNYLMVHPWHTRGVVAWACLLNPHTSESPYTVVRDVIPQKSPPHRTCVSQTPQSFGHAPNRWANPQSRNLLNTTIPKTRLGRSILPNAKFQNANFQPQNSNSNFQNTKIQDAAFEMAPRTACAAATPGTHV